MKEMILMLAHVMPLDDIIKRIGEEIKKYQINPTEENLNRLQISCTLLNTKGCIEASGGEMEGITKMMKDMNDMDKGRKMLNPEKN